MELCPLRMWARVQITNLKIKAMELNERFEQAFIYFKKSYTRKMGGTQTVILPNGRSKYFDDRKYYEGQGKRYNRSNMHQHIGKVKVSRKAYSEFYNYLKDKEQQAIENLKRKAEKKSRIAEAESKGIYSIYERFVEFEGKFNPEILAKTLKISEKDANLLMSEGKTYVFAQSEDGKLYKMYHPSLTCNDLYIQVLQVTHEYFIEFSEKWGEHGQFAELLGQSENKNHFVC